MLPDSILWEWESLPYLTRNIRESAIFLYPSVEDAENRTEWGGSGFLVGIPSEASPSHAHLYAVSNAHVAAPCPVIRLTIMNPAEEDETHIIPGASADWIEHPDGDDMAVRPLGAVAVPPLAITEAGQGYAYFDIGRLLSVDTLRLGTGPMVGDDCLMVGRYVNHEGQQFDGGVVRFGNLSMWPEPVRQHKRSFDQESFLVDMRSAPGFSGSAVIVYFTAPGTIKRTTNENMPWRSLISEHWVLGIDWGHLPVSQKIWEDGKSKRVKAESSMAAVVPAWKLTELLEKEERIVKPREAAEAELAQGNENAAELDGHGTSEFEQFEDVLSKVIRVPKKELDEKREEEKGGQ